MGHLGVNDMQECKYAVTLPAYLPRLFPLLLSLYSSPPHCFALSLLALSLPCFVTPSLCRSIASSNSLCDSKLPYCHSKLLSLAWHPWLCHSQTLPLSPLFYHGVTVRRSFCSSSTWFPFQPDEIMIPSRFGFTAQLECFVNKRISQ